MNVKKVVLVIAESVRAECTTQGRIPFFKGDLRKSVQVFNLAGDAASVGSTLPYSRAVHDGRPALTIKPNTTWNPPHGERTTTDPAKARLKFNIGGRVVFARSVDQKARKPQPFITDAADRLEVQGWKAAMPMIEREIGEELAEKLVSQIKINV